MKYMQLEIETETADEMAKVLIQAIPLMDNMGLKYTIAYKDSIVEEEVRKMMAEHLSDNKFITHDN
jgi:uncharacterized lipoprotein YehR (DUF1307 family)